jgi:peptidylprolyl isomerase
MPPMQRLLLIIAACLALALVGCGDDSDTYGSNYSGPEVKEEREAKEREAAEKEDAEREAAEEKAATEIPEVTVPGGPPPKQLVVEDLKQGNGKAARAGDQVAVHYAGVLYDDGEMFDANWGEETEPFSFTLGAQEVIAGWDKGIAGMKVGGERKLVIPPDLAYGEQGFYPSIPPNATLVFQVELLSVK